MLNVKKVKTVRFEESELTRIRLASKKQGFSEAEVIRKAVKIGLIDLINGEEEDELLRLRLSDKSPDVDGRSFLAGLKKEFGL